MMDELDEDTFTDDRREDNETGTKTVLVPRLKSVDSNINARSYYGFILDCLYLESMATIKVFLKKHGILEFERAAEE